MFERVWARINRSVLRHVPTHWVDYVVSNTMTDFNRWANSFLWTYDSKALVEEVRDEAPGVKTFVLRPNQHWRGFQAGQHVELVLTIDGKTHRRCYSLSASAQGCVSITVKYKAGGLVSNWLHAHARVGTQLALGHVRGRFVNQQQPKLLFLCAGSGMTPCHSMVQALLAKPLAEQPDIHVMAQFRQAPDIIFKHDLQAWQQAGVTVTVGLSRLTPADAASGHCVPRLDAQQLQRHCPDLTARDIYLCGPEGFMTQMVAHLQALGVDLKRVHTERFNLAVPQAASRSAVDLDGAEVLFSHVNARIALTAADQGKTLLQLATAHGVNLESGCEKGSCGTCKLTVHEGQVAGNVLGATVYLCTAYPASRWLVLGA